MPKARRAPDPDAIDWNAVDADAIDDVVLALLQLTLHDDDRAWKGHDWEVTNRLHEKGFLYDPKNKAKSVVLTPEGLVRSRAVFKRLFGAGGGVRRALSDEEADAG